MAKQRKKVVSTEVRDWENLIVYHYDDGSTATVAGHLRVPSDPIAVANRRDIMEGSTIDMLKQVLLATRVRSTAGFKPFRCYACDYPHVNGVCRGNCVHHKAIKLLKNFGVDTTGLVDN